MATKRSPAVTSEAEQAYELEHPSREVIWARAVEVLGTQELARQWMGTPLPILDQHSPEQYANSKDKAKQREVLVILGRIDYGLFS
ncbi:MAG: antitoxin Xre/MbcA/ParS toxin-binding domain-containing protein [Bryobacteraceae bacterium]